MATPLDRLHAHLDLFGAAFEQSDMNVLDSVLEFFGDRVLDPELPLHFRTLYSGLYIAVIHMLAREELKRKRIESRFMSGLVESWRGRILAEVTKLHASGFVPETLLNHPAIAFTPSAEMYEAALRSLRGR